MKATAIYTTEKAPPSSAVCGICRNPLDQPTDPGSRDCGGDCLRCMAEFGEDPEAIASMREIDR